MVGEIPEFRDMGEQAGPPVELPADGTSDEQVVRAPGFPMPDEYIIRHSQPAEVGMEGVETTETAFGSIIIDAISDYDDVI